MKLPDHRRRECLSAAIVQTMWLMAGCSLVFMVTAYASNPGWWSSVLNGNPANDYMVANQGQLKNFTSVAVSEMNATLTNAGGSGPALSNLVYGWQQDYATNGYGATNLKPSDYAGINVGQLKYVGNLVWSQLIAAGYTEYPPSWLGGSNASDLQAANLGQMKEVFNFDPTVAPASVTGLTATPEPGEIDLSWTDPTNNPVTSLLVQEEIDGTWTTIATLDASATAYAATGLTPGTSYSLQVIASNALTSSSSTRVFSIQPLAPSPGGLTGTLDTTNSYMNLSWPASSGATTYAIDRETITNGVWSMGLFSSSTNSYTDTNSSYGGYRYQVHASADGTNYSAPSNVFPQPQYAIIDLGTNQTPRFFNNAGSVVLTPTGASTYTYWSGGSTTTIPLGTVYGMNTNGVVIGTETNSVEYQNTNISLYLDHAPPPLTTWTAANGLGAALPDPTSDYIADAPLSPNEGITAQWQGNIGGTPVGIGDDNATVYGNYSEGYGDDITAISAGFGAELGTLTRIGDIIISTNTYQSPITYPPGPVLISTVATPGTLDTFTTQNGANVALGYQETVDGSGDYSSPTWVAYDGASFHTLAYQPQCIASNNDIVGNDGGSTNVYLWTNYVLAATPVNGISGPINNQDQIVFGHQIWQTNQLSNLNDVVPDSSGWNYISAGNFNGTINDSGAIVGTATYSGTNTSIAAGSHGVLLLPDKIQRDGQDMTGTNANVWVGQQICLTNMVMGSPTNSIVTSYQWHIPGVTGSTNDMAFYDYEPTKYNSNYTNLVTPTNYTTNSYINFYWCGDATNLPVSCTQVIYGQTNTVSATLNVQKPSAVITALHGIIAVDAGNWQSGDSSTALHFGSTLTGATPGMAFGVNASVFPAGSNSTNNLIWNQLINSNYTRLTTATGTLTLTNSGGYDSGNPPNDSYPYNNGNEADDSPGRASLQTNYTSCTKSFSATMYFMWQPSTNMVGGDKTVPVALRCWPWQWSATATNGAPSAGWGLENSNYPSVTVPDVDVTSPPIWTNESPSAWQHSGSL